MARVKRIERYAEQQGRIEELERKLKSSRRYAKQVTEQLEAVRDCYVVGNATQTHINMFKLLGEGDE